MLALSILLAGVDTLAGEIVIGASPKGKAGASVSTSSAASEAGRQRDAARDYRKGQVAPDVLVIPEGEDGVLSPYQELDTAEGNVARARAERQGDSGQGSVLVPLGGDGRALPGESAAAQSARKNREKAAAYRKGTTSSAVVATGNDALPVVDCSNVENTAGRVGDDAKSGSIITLIQGRNQVRVRCR